MSIENGERFIRLLQQDPVLRRRITKSGEAEFLKLSAEAQASCTPFEVVAAMIRGLDRQPQ